MEREETRHNNDDSAGEGKGGKKGDDDDDSGKGKGGKKVDNNDDSGKGKGGKNGDNDDDSGKGRKKEDDDNDSVKGKGGEDLSTNRNSLRTAFRMTGRVLTFKRIKNTPCGTISQGRVTTETPVLFFVQQHGFL